MEIGDAALGLYQLVDHTWSNVVSCDWQCKPQEESTTMAVQPTEAPLQSTTLDEKDAHLGLYQFVDPNWNFVVSCDWQCKPEGEEQQPQLQPQPQPEVPAQPPPRSKCNVPLAESDARIGLYQLVDHRWNFAVSCDWQCKPPRRHKAKTTKAEPDDGRERQASPVTGETAESGGVPLSESDAALGLYQLVNPRWDFCVSCEWQCKPPGEAEESERGEAEVMSTSSLSTCREDGPRGSLFQQTGGVMLTLVGDEGEMGLVMIDELGSDAELRVSPEVALDEQAAEQRKSRLEQLMRDLGDQTLDYDEDYEPMHFDMYGWALHPVQEVAAEPVAQQPKDDKKAARTPEPAASPAPQRPVHPMYGWAILPPPEVSMKTPASSAAPSKVTAGGRASAAVSDGTLAETLTAGEPAPEAAAAAGAQHEDVVEDSAVRDVCKERRRRQVRKAQVRYAPVSNCPFVSCGPTKPLRTFREKPDSCLPRRK